MHRMQRRIGIMLGAVAGLVAYAGATATGAQPSPMLTCDPKTIPSTGPSVTFTCSIGDFPPNTPVTVVGVFGPPRQLTTDDAGRAGFTFLIPEFGVCAPLSGELTISASGGGVEASTTIVVRPVPVPPVFCGPESVPAQPRLTG
jgi:hypothetical protein